MIVDVEKMEMLLLLARIAEKINRVIDDSASFVFTVDEDGGLDIDWDYLPEHKRHLID